MATPLEALNELAKNFKNVGSVASTQEVLFNICDAFKTLEQNLETAVAENKKLKKDKK